MFDNDSIKSELYSWGNWEDINPLSMYIFFYLKTENKVVDFPVLRW